MLATTVSTRAAKATTMASPKPELQPVINATATHSFLSRHALVAAASQAII
jgi:hypothetical protein